MSKPCVACILSIACIGLVFSAAAFAADPPKSTSVAEEDLLTPTEILGRCGDTLPPLNYTIKKDEIVTSDTDPTKKLRRIEVQFYTSVLEGRRWGHPSVIFMPANPKDYLAKERRGKVVIVAQRNWDGLATGPWRDAFLGNYGEPIAATTGYPTMVCPIPGEYDNTNQREISIGFLHNLYRKTQNPADTATVRQAVPYLYAMDVMADVLKVDKRDIRAVIGGHSKRVAAYMAAAMDPQRVVGVVYMGNESNWDHYPKSRSPLRALQPPHTKKWVTADVLYIGATNEDGYEMFSIRRMQAMMDGKWTIEYIPNYRHGSMSEKHFIDWRMWVAHCFEGRPITKITDLSREDKGPEFVWGGRQYGAGGGTLFRCKLDTPNKIIQAKVWYVYCDDVPYWRDLMWYPEFMVPQPDGTWAGYVKGKLPDAWLVEVKDTAGGYPGYVTSLPQDITGKETKNRHSRGSRSRNWEPK
ncbi:MAG: hypothetical protein JW888_11535 [Pirellulales bacterium]|nr:hypothetical protein [Pirellulales bacterium]